MQSETLSTLTAEADAAIATAPADPLDAPAAGLELAQPFDAVAEWRQFMDGAVTVVSVVALPQWNLTPEEQREFSTALSGCLAQLFPDGLNGRYACWFRLVACTGGITLMRLVQNNGKLPGFGPRRAQASAATDTDTRQN